MKSNIFEVRKEILNSLGGNSTGLSSVYEVDLQILGVLSKGVGGGSSIDDSVVATDKTWSSKKIMDTVGVGFNVSVVDELPETGDEHTIYLVSKTGTDTDVYNEYLYVNGAYEKIGSTDIDLTNYVTDAPWDGKQYVRQDGAWVEASSGDSGGFSVISDEPDYLTVCHDASSDGSTQVKVSFDNSVVTPDIKYSIWDNGVMTQDWTQWDYSELTVPSKNGAIKFKGTNTQSFSHGFNSSNLFIITGPARVQGNIMSLIDEQIDGTKTINGGYFFRKAFYGSSIISVSKNLLPATTLTMGCYLNMFSNCTALTTAPKLRATTITNYCYANMFDGCSSLTAAPALPATTLAVQCYDSMFQKCTSLETAPELPATTLADICYQNMFFGCTSLIKAPELPATTIANSCYQNMFYGCTNLNYIKCLATDIRDYNALNDWVYNVSQTGTFVKAKGVDWPSSGIPWGWTVVDAELEVKSEDVYNIWSGTQEEYDAITDKSDTVLYLIKES